MQQPPKTPQPPLPRKPKPSTWRYTDWALI